MKLKPGDLVKLTPTFDEGSVFYKLYYGVVTEYPWVTNCPDWAKRSSKERAMIFWIDDLKYNFANIEELEKLA